MLIFHDPDGIEHHPYTEAPHGIDKSDEPRAGRPVRFPPERGGIHNEERDARDKEEVRPGVP